MPDQAQLEERRTILRGRGIPERFIDNLAARRDQSFVDSLKRIALPSIVVIAAIIIFANTVQKVSPVAASIMYSHLAPHILYQAGSSFVVFMPLSIDLIAISFFLLVVLSGIGQAKPFPAYNATASDLRELRAGETMTTVKLREMPDNVETLIDDTALLKALSRKSFKQANRLVAKALAIIWVGGALLAIWASQSYQLLTMDGLEVHTPFTTSVYPLNTAVRADVVCYNDVPSNGFQYRLVFPNRVFAASTGLINELTPPQIVNRLAILDQRLAQLHVPIHRMPSSGAPADDANACMTHLLKKTPGIDSGELRHLVFGA